MRGLCSPLPVGGGLGKTCQAPLPTQHSSDLIPRPAEPQGEPLTITCARALALRDVSTEQTGITELPHANLEGACDDLTTTTTHPARVPHHHTSAQSTDIPWESATAWQDQAHPPSKDARPRAPSHRRK